MGAPESLREEDDGEVAQPELATSVSHTSRGAVQLRSSPEGLAQQQEASVEAAPSSGTGVTRRLSMEETRVLSLSACRRAVTSAIRDMPPLRARRLNLGWRSKGT